MMTQAFQRIERAASYSPDRLKVLGNAFDGAWASIAGNFDDEAAAKSARMHSQTSFSAWRAARSMTLSGSRPRLFRLWQSATGMARLEQSLHANQVGIALSAEA